MRYFSQVQNDFIKNIVETGSVFLSLDKVSKMQKVVFRLINGNIEIFDPIKRETAFSFVKKKLVKTLKPITTMLNKKERKVKIKLILDKKVNMKESFPEIFIGDLLNEVFDALAYLKQSNLILETESGPYFSPDEIFGNYSENELKGNCFKEMDIVQEALFRKLIPIKLIVKEELKSYVKWGFMDRQSRDSNRVIFYAILTLWATIGSMILSVSWDKIKPILKSLFKIILGLLSK